ncbi:MAG: hypothetical protein NTU59_03720 [Coprothermobacterota bacterium]|nr:hypothetical protein [Coprothermobacterota bacterium]
MTTRNTKPDDVTPSVSGEQALRRQAEEIALPLSRPALGRQSGENG